MNSNAQLSMFSRTPASRSTDPESSHEAEAEVNRSGARANQQNRVLALVRRFPGRTSRELAELANLDRYMIARRLPELAPVQIRRGDLRKCGMTKKRAVTWWPVEKNGTGAGQ